MKENKEDHSMKKKSIAFKASTQLDDMKESGGNGKNSLLPRHSQSLIF